MNLYLINHKGNHISTIKKGAFPMYLTYKKGYVSPHPPKKKRKRKKRTHKQSQFYYVILFHISPLAVL